MLKLLKKETQNDMVAASLFPLHTVIHKSHLPYKKLQILSVSQVTCHHICLRQSCHDNI